MEDDEVSVTNINEALSQSYIQGVERIRRELNIVEIFELSNETLAEREKSWNQLFDKYSRNIPDDHELIIERLNSGSNKNNMKDDENADDDEHFEKCRIPIRKHPALVQYWVNTGNPPYQLADENSSSAGSSLSEDENSKASLLLVNQCSDVGNKHDNSTSLYSSVDTAAYILSNTNITKKSETMAIVEGAKDSSIPPKKNVNSPTENRLSMNSSKDCIVTNKTVDNYNNNDSDKLKTNEVLGLTTNTLREKKSENDRNLSATKEPSNAAEKIEKNLKISSIHHFPHSTMKITDILPTLAHLDKMLCSQNKQDEEDIAVNNEVSLLEETPKNSESPKLYNRKKLYTERHSPIDVIVSRSSTDRRKSIQTNSHPALSTPTLFARRRTSRLHQRRKKRLSQISKASKTLENEDDNKEHDETTVINDSNDELKASEVTQSRKKPQRHTTGTLASVKKVLKRNFRKQRRSSKTLQGGKATRNEKVISGGVKEDIQCESTLDELIALCSRKNLEIRLERIVEPNLLPKNYPSVIINKHLEKLTSTSSDKSTNDICEVNSESHESDQSTILIYKCATDQELNTTVNTDNINELEKKINNNITKLNSIRVENEIEMITNKNRSSEEKKNIKQKKNNIQRFCTASTNSDANSSTKSPPRSQIKWRTRSTNNVVNFQFDEENEFTKLIKENLKKRSESKVDISVNDFLNNCENLIHDLTNDYIDSKTVETIDSTTSMNAMIVESDDEEIIISKNSATKSKKVNRQKQITISKEPLMRTRGKSRSFNGINSNEKFAKNPVARQLEFRSSTDESTVDEDTDRELKTQKNNNKKSLEKLEKLPDNKNIKVTSIERKENGNNNQTSLRFCSVSLDSDDDSSTNNSRRSQIKSRRSLSRPVIKFSLDDEDDFVKMIREDAKKHAEKKHNNTSKSDTSLNNNMSDRENLIYDLTSDSAVTLAINSVIVDSDDEELDNSQQVSTKNKKRKSKRLEVSNESLIPEKKLKLGRNIESPTLNKKRIEKPREKIKKSSEKDSNGTTTLMHEDMPLSAPKRKMGMNLTKETDEMLSKNKEKSSPTSESVNEDIHPPERKKKMRTNRKLIFTEETSKMPSENRKKSSAKPESSMNLSNLYCKDVSVCLERLEPSKLNVSVPSPSSEKVEIEISKNPNKNTKIQLKNSMNAQQTNHKEIIVNKLDESTNCKSLKFDSRRRSPRVNVNNESKKTTRTFQTRSDDSDSDL